MKKLLTLLSVLIAGTMLCPAVTFNVRVPAGTQKCYVCGAFNDWDADGAVELDASGDNQFTLNLTEVSDLSGGFKYLCGLGWDYVEKDANGDEIDNRTSAGNPDVVGSWRSMPEYGIESHEITLNGVKRLIKVYLPAGYEDSTDSYPVIYYNTVQQRYNNAGDDSDAGDYFFGRMSWNAHSVMENLREEGGRAYIMVQVCSFLGENTPEAHADFAGSGQAATYLTAFANELMPFVEAKWRVAKGPEATTIVGADYAALFSLYASLTRPDLFGQCVAMSPMLWINDGVFDGFVSSAGTGQSYYITAGSLEPQWLTAGASALSGLLESAGAKAYYTQFEGGLHDDESWGREFPAVLSALEIGTAPVVSAYLGVAAGRAAAVGERAYTLYAGTDKNALQPVGALSYTSDYRKSGTDTPISAMIITNEIPADVKSKYYWNIALGDDDTAGWLLENPHEIGFSSKKNSASWHNVAVFDDASVYNVAAHSAGFKVVTASGKTAMEPEAAHVSTATVSFPSADKSFRIHYGSVNSGSDMGALTPSISVGEACTKAEISYDFDLNKVTVTELETGATEPPTDFRERVYTLYGGENQDVLQRIGSLVYTEDFRKKGTAKPVEAFVITHNIPASVKSTYYWNIANGADGNAGWIFDSPKNIGFKSSKSEDSWQNIAVFADGTTAETAAHSKGFRVVSGNNKTVMTPSAGHVSTATVAFPGADKSFAVHFGSVNSASDMGAMTPSVSVGDNCVEAIVSYDFNLNKLTVEETRFGESLDGIKVLNFSAVPSVCHAGADVRLNLTLSEDCDIELSCKRDFAQTVRCDIEKPAPGVYDFSLTSASEGIYSFSVSLVKDGNSLPDAALIYVRVLPEGAESNPRITLNAYENVDWDKTGRYKANFHTHTSQSFDTRYSTSVVVDKYQKANYRILALTDHDANSYPWNMFSLYNPEAEDRNPAEMGMLAIPGNELSKDRRNSWSEKSGGEFNHHNDLFTGRKGQEFMSLRESYAYTQAIGGLQIINHPGQYWNIATSYTPGEKNSPEWHAENFRLYNSLVGLEVYNQGNRRPNDRILWDQILTINMPETPVWGYSCDDTHTEEQYFRNYQFMLMPELTVDALKTAMRNGATVFSYEYTGSGEDKAPHITSIDIDEVESKITVNSDDADNIEWVYSTHRTVKSSSSSTQSTVVGLGKTFDFSNFQGSYVRARLTNKFGETATQPFGFAVESGSTKEDGDIISEIAGHGLTVYADRQRREVTVESTEAIDRVSVVNAAGSVVMFIEADGGNRVTFSTADLSAGVYVVVAANDYSAYTGKFINR